MKNIRGAVTALFLCALFAAAPGLARATCATTPGAVSAQYFSQWPTLWGFNPTIFAGAPGFATLSMDGTCDLNVNVVSGGGGAVTGTVGIDQTTQGTTNGVVTKSGSVTTATPPATWAGALTQTTGSCTTSSSTIITANAATTSMTLFLPSTAANGVWVEFNGVAATAALPSFNLLPGASITFTLAGGLLPTSAVTCIATATTSVGEIYK
jgi:hypothetical protein